ncbi:AAA family ATPase [Paenibacillus sp. LMG 31459]|uniref:DNA 3'-5' helicase n=1 Tax=Paenibacillus phytohabitans TaxID=2654978 RepID=A0ABX1YVL7_9BACL|nr:3'-5' exonuclease [Paenibacillus phytohabitans]NOU83896.1 AAA family ATPase [Paenibacillus phytohabitans]
MPIPNPIGIQTRVLYLPEIGHFVILGTAGSGKTTLAILRAAYLAKTHCRSNEKVLLVTFNRTLVTYLQTLGEQGIRNLDIWNYHKFARGYLSRRNKMGWNEIASSGAKIRFINEALENVRKIYPDNSTLERPAEVFVEEIHWLQKTGITSLKEYEAVERIGRAGTWIARANRKYFYYVFNEYMRLRGQSGLRYDFEDLAGYVDEEFESDTSPRYYRHIIIDEGQDFSPAMLRSLAKAIPTDGSITYFGDVAQQIYGSRVSWRTAGLNNPQIYRFAQNYRNTKEIAALGLAISEQPFFPEDTDLVEPSFPRASGPKPALISFSSEEEELDYYIANVIIPNRTRTIVILVRSVETVDYIINKIRQKRITPQKLSKEMSVWNSRPGVSVGTYHSAKGLEFDTVILPFCTANRLPSPERVTALDNFEEALNEEVKLLYVGVTRAKSELYISYTGEVTVLLPTDPELYQM